jgi:ribosomal protein L11 methyltransferase
MKSTKPLWRFSVTTSAEAEDAVAELLGSKFGTAASAYFNLETRISLVNVFSEKPFSRPQHQEVSAGLAQIKGYGLDIGAGAIEIAKVKREDWAESWKKHFHPIEIGDALLVKPSWIKQRPRKNQAVLILDPGLSFGTGQHPTTSFCLRQLASRATRNTQHATRSFLDIGSGSGILAIAAAKLGYQPVDAFDFDPEAVRIARENARKNRVSRKIHITRKDVTKLPLRNPKQYDLICANLISTLLLAERARILARLKRTGVLVVAGILNSEFALVQRDYERSGLRLIASKVEKEWRSSAFTYRLQTDK